MSATDVNICDAAVSARFSNGLLATLQSTDSYGMAWSFAIHGDKGVARFKTNPWLPVAGDNIIEMEIYGKAHDQIVVSTGLDAFQHQVLTAETALRDGVKQAPGLRLGSPIRSKSWNFSPSGTPAAVPAADEQDHAVTKIVTARGERLAMTAIYFMLSATWSV